jgi:hypothetical protein
MFLIGDILDPSGIVQEAKVKVPLPRACTVAWHGGGCSQSHRLSWRWQLVLWSFILFLES